MFRIHPSPSEAPLLSFLKAGFLLYSNYHLHDNAPGLYKPLTPPCIPLFFPPCGACHYAVHTGTGLNAKRAIRIKGVGLGLQTSPVLLSSVFCSAAVWSW